MNTFAEYWDTHFNRLKNTELDTRYIPPQVVSNLLAEMPPMVKIDTIGKSADGKSIYELVLGRGEKRVLAWAAMHGNETTALRGWLDLILALHNEKILSFFEPLLQQFTIHFIPQLNPDGAMHYRRRNAQNIDLNRDVRALQTPEMQLLVARIEALQPVLAFNLHDQRNIFRAGNKSATISFLAPAEDESRSLTASRAQTMDLIGAAAKALKNTLKGGIGRYSDAFYPTAIGEYVQQKGVQTILVECGAAENDPLRDEARKANAIIIYSVLQRLLIREAYETETYNTLPINSTNQVDVVIKNAQIRHQNAGFYADIALLIEDKLKNGRLISRYLVHDFGHLPATFGLETHFWEENLFEKPLEIGSAADFAIYTDKGLLKFENGQRAG